MQSTGGKRGGRWATQRSQTSCQPCRLGHAGSDRQPGLQGQPQDEAVGVGRRGEESAGSQTIARFPDHGALSSGELRSNEETQKKDCKKFRGEES